MLCPVTKRFGTAPIPLEEWVQGQNGFKDRMGSRTEWGAKKFYKRTEDDEVIPSLAQAVRVPS
jgi:hypothetical protein